MRIVINLKPISVNHALGLRSSGRFITKYKTKALKEFNNEFEKQFKRYRQESDKFLSEYDKRKQSVKLSIKFEIKNFFTAKKTINLRSGDVDNFSKYSVDNLCDNMGFNDAEITELHLRKVPGRGFRIIYDIELIDLDQNDQR